MSYVKWDEIPETKKEGRFLKWKDGKNRIRLIGRLMTYEQEWPSGIAARYVCSVIDLDDDNKVKIATFKKALLDVLRAYHGENGDPAGPDAPAFLVIKTGTGMETKYQCLPGSKPCPIPANIDVATEEKKLVEFVDKQQMKRPVAQDDELHMDDAA